ncbi:MAG TPA: isochorismatase family cysteine hydrolase [Nocardioidaceae bacterium]|nr:isochorismatase family cysteine hydrolase [Nocardioidaceae bacterium]
MNPAAEMSSALEGPSRWTDYALILVDVQNDFWSEEIASESPRFPSRIEALLGTCRELGIEVFHVHGGFQEDMSDWIARYRLRGQIPCVVGTEGAEPLPVAVPRPGERVVVKQSFDAFLGTGLDELLRSAGKRFVFVAGLVTSTCVLLTAATATQRGYLVALVEDCCADRQRFHDYVLRAYHPFMFGITRSDRISHDRPQWDEQLEQLVG